MIYLDNAATTPLCDSAREAFLRVSGEYWGNPSSLHAFGQRAKRVLDQARRTLSSQLGIKENELFFTSGGSESDSLAILGTAARHKSGRILVSQLEHPAVAEPVSKLRDLGFEVVTIPWGGSPRAFLDNVAIAATPDTILASFMLVHNETGLVLPVAEAAKRVKSANPAAVIHCDAVQGFCKIPIRADHLGADLLSISAHKIHGPGGIGGIYVRSGVKLRPMIIGGGQESGIRSGTEPVALAAAFAAAADEWQSHGEERTHQAQEFRERLKARLTGTCVLLNLAGQDTSPFVISLSAPPIPSEVLLRILEGEGILVSAGSACTKNRKSKTIATLLSKEQSGSVIRVSLGGQNRPQEADALADALIKASKGFGQYAKK